MAGTEHGTEDFVRRLLQGELPEEDIPKQYTGVAQPRDRLFTDSIIEQASVTAFDEDVPDAEEAVRLDITYTQEARSVLGLDERDATLYAYLLDGDELFILDRDNMLFGAFHHSHVEQTLGLADVTERLVETVSESVPGIEFGEVASEGGTYTVRVHPRVEPNDPGDLLDEIGERPADHVIWQASGYTVWHVDERYILGRVDGEQQEIEIERIVPQTYDIDLGPLRNRVNVDIEHDHPDTALQAVPDTLLDMAEDCRERGPLGIHTRTVQESELLVQVDEQREKVAVHGIGPYTIRFTDSAAEEIETAYDGGTQETGLLSALADTVLQRPASNKLAKRSHRTGSEAPPVGYVPVDRDQRLYFAFNQETEHACVLVAGGHDRLQDWYRSDTAALIEQAIDLLERSGLDPGQYLGDH